MINCRLFHSTLSRSKRSFLPTVEWFFSCILCCYCSGENSLYFTETNTGIALLFMTHIRHNLDSYCFKLLTIFVNGNVKDYQTFYDQNKEFVESVGKLVVFTLTGNVHEW